MYDQPAFKNSSKVQRIVQLDAQKCRKLSCHGRLVFTDMSFAGGSLPAGQNFCLYIEVRMFTCSSSGIMKRVLMSRPTYLQAAPINEIAKKWSSTRLDCEKMEKEHQLMVEAYTKNGVKVEFLEPDAQRPNSVFSRDFGLCVREGYILGNFRESIRFKEKEAYKNKMKELNVPLIAEVKDGFFEGGDFTYLDAETLAIGQAARSDEKGVNFIRKALEPYGYKVICVPCHPKYLHFDLVFNMVDTKLAVACSPALPQDFLNLVKNKGIELIEVSEESVFMHGCNLQSIGNKRVLCLKQNAAVNEKLAERGYTIIEVDITEILKAGGGPHCMTFPLERE